MTAPLVALSALGRAALAYARDFGWRVLPLHAPGLQGECSCGNAACPSPAKHPRTAHGLSDASAEATVVIGWWQRWPAANVGIATGAASGLVVVDLDGPEAEQAFASRYGNPPTASCLTGRGRHLYFQHPGGLITNSAGALGAKIDVRGDGGYVVAPPSHHARGHVYAWDRANGMGPRECPPSPLPSALLAALRAAPSPAVTAPARVIPLLEQVGEGQRNATLAQYAGRLLAKGHALAETFELVLALNAEKCRPPLARDEVWQIVQSIGGREARKPHRITDTGRRLEVADVPPEAMITPQAMAQAQAAAAVERGRLDLSGAPRWMWPDLHALTGPMLPGEMVTVGALTGNGKTAFLMSQMAWAAVHRIPTVYLGLEKDPTEIRRHWAAWQLGLEWKLVHQNAWHRLPEGAQEAHEAMIAEQAENRYVQFPPDMRVDVAGLAKWCRWGVEQMGARQIVVDHFHRMEFGGANAQYRIAVTEAARTMRDLARANDVALIGAAQLNRTGDELLDRYFPPPLQRLKESAGIAEESTVVLMLARRLRVMLDADTIRLVRAGHRQIREFEEPGTMQVTCRKHRLDEEARDRSVLLHVNHGKVGNRVESYREHVLGDA